MNRSVGRGVSEEKSKGRKEEVGLSNHPRDNLAAAPVIIRHRRPAMG
jgi:hypothetical protein